MRHHVPRWVGELSSNARRYNATYHPGSVSRNRFKLGSSQQPDEIALTENGGSIHMDSRIVKEVQWNVTEERVDAVRPHFQNT